MQPPDSSPANNEPAPASPQNAQVPWDADDPLGDEAAFPSTWQHLEADEEA